LLFRNLVSLRFEKPTRRLNLRCAQLFLN
jgi:hypothetical protein